MSKIPVSFRLERQAHRALALAASKAGMKPANYVEQAVLEKLADFENCRTSQELISLRQQIDQLRAELSLATEAVLVVAGSNEPYSPDKAREWVSGHLPRRLENGTQAASDSGP